MASIVKTPSGKFKAIIRKNGRLLKTKTFSRKTDAKAWAVRIEGDREMLAAYGIGGASMPFRELANEYDAQWNGDSRIRSQLVYLREKLGDYTLMNIDRFVVKGVIAEYAEGEVLRYNGSEKLGYQLKKTGKPRAASTINCLRARLSAIFRYAIENDYVTSNPVAGTKTWTLNNKRERFLNDEERSRLLDVCRQSEWARLYLLVLMALTTGARLGEMLNLRWSDLDLAKRRATLHKTKNGSKRVLTLPVTVIDELMGFREIGKGLLFPSQRKPDKPFEFRKHWNRAVKDTGLDDFRFHDLRHSAASYLVMNGATLYEAGEVLGHKSLQTTKRYAHLSVEHKQALTDRIMGEIR